MTERVPTDLGSPILLYFAYNLRAGLSLKWLRMVFVLLLSFRV